MQKLRFEEMKLTLKRQELKGFFKISGIIGKDKLQRRRKVCGGEKAKTEREDESV